MKTKLLLFSLLLIIGFHANAQYVIIPDANFVKFLQSKYPSCMKGNQIDTTCAAIKNETTLNVSYLNIFDLTGVEYFRSLYSINCSNNSLTNLPTVLNSLSYLYCDNNQLTNLSTLPTSLGSLSCNHNQLTTLPTLPRTLQYLNCGNNKLNTLPAIPNSLAYLQCNDNQLIKLESTPKSKLSVLETQNAAHFVDKNVYNYL